ncbi:M14 family zinc carboxypeptidase [Bacteroidota bacterium]
MKNIKKLGFWLSILILSVINDYPLIGQDLGFPDALYTKAERTNYLETSMHSDVMNFVNTLVGNTELARLEIIGASLGGRDIPLVIMANPMILTPEEAVESGKLVVYVQANIHAGEVEGKETTMEIMREIAFGPKNRLLENQILIFCPIYNADGNDALSPNNRSSQEGSPIEAGERFSGEGYDLNRDGLKIDAIETKAMMQNVMNKWDPLVFVDMHTTNGVWHGYSITYAAGMHTAGHSGTFNYLMDELFPAVNSRVKERSGFDTFLYGSFYNYPPQVFEAAPYMPRFLWNSMALKNKLGILIETFAHDRFEKRILSNNAFLTSLFEYTSEHYDDIQTLIANINNEVIEEINTSGGQLQKGVTFDLADWGDSEDLLVYEVIGNKRTGKRIWSPDVRMLQTHIPAKLATVPKAYIFPEELSNVAAKLIEHGIEVSVLSGNTSFQGEEYTVTSFTQDNYSYQNHYRTHINGSFRAETKEMPAGSYYVDMAQPYAYCIFYMLEPEADDGLVLWNFFDDYLINGGVMAGDVEFPVFKAFSVGNAGIVKIENETDFRVFPNPNSGNFYIDFLMPVSSKIDMEILNLEGKVMLSKEFAPGSKKYSIDAKSCSKGIYLLRIKTNNSSSIKRIVLN